MTTGQLDQKSYRDVGYKAENGKIVYISELTDGQILYTFQYFRHQCTSLNHMEKDPRWLPTPGNISYHARMNQILGLVKLEMRRRKLSFAKLLRDAKEANRKDDKGKTS